MWRVLKQNLVIFAVILLVVGCASTTTKKTSKVDPKYGVSASPRVAKAGKRLRRGGGVRRTGKAYKIAGKWYKPRNYKRYNRVGYASWYGRAFHGRLTANGEVYDMRSLSAAHPTLPLPSYVRVTNMKKRRSVILRVNDRGPFARSRIIDLSKRAAQVLGTIQQGVAKVRVQYLGRAPLRANDEAYLYASIRGSKIPRVGKKLIQLAKVAKRRKSSSYRRVKPRRVAVKRSLPVRKAPVAVVFVKKPVVKRRIVALRPAAIPMPRPYISASLAPLAGIKASTYALNGVTGKLPKTKIAQLLEGQIAQEQTSLPMIRQKLPFKRVNNLNPAAVNKLPSPRQLPSPRPSSLR